MVAKAKQAGHVNFAAYRVALARAYQEGSSPAVEALLLRRLDAIRDRVRGAARGPPRS